MSEFDYEGVFDEDYLYFYEEGLAERTPEDVARIVELLELQPGAEILDCPSGHGRISNPLAERGFRVTGLDATELFLERARADAAGRGVEVEYVHGDMRELPWRQRITRILLAPRPLDVTERDGNLMIDRWEADPESSRFRTERVVVRDGRARKTHFSIRWFTVPELRSWLEEAGFENALTPGLAPDTRLVVVADRTG